MNGAEPDRVRRGLLGGVVATFFAGRTPVQAADRNGERQTLLRGVRRWGCQYQGISVDAVAASPLDLVALETSLDDAARRFITPEDMLRLKRKPDGSRRLVLGYLPVGEVDVKRWYYKREWRERTPSWVGPANPDWPGARHARYWDPDWQRFLATGADSLLPGILQAGFDGALLDRVDAYGDWRDERPSAGDDMIDLVQRIRATARSVDPGFLLVPQNAEHLLLSQRYTALIDGLNKESLLTGLAGEGLPNGEEDVGWSLARLQAAQRDGVTILATEYGNDPAQRRRLAERLRSYGFKPFFGRRELDRLPADGEA